MQRIVFDFLWITVLISLLMAGIFYLIPGLQGSSGIVATVVAAMSAGQLHGRRTGELIESGPAWSVAVVLTLVSLVFGLVIILGLNAMDISVLPPDVPEISAGRWAIGIAVATLICLVAVYFSFRFGVRQGVKLAQMR